jgi:hypothetical protein
MMSQIPNLHKLPFLLSCQPLIEHPPLWMYPHHTTLPRMKQGLRISYPINESLTKGALLKRVQGPSQIKKIVQDGDVGDVDRYVVRVLSKGIKVNLYKEDMESSLTMRGTLYSAKHPWTLKAHIELSEG